MKLWIKAVLMLVLVPVVASAQYKDLDTALTSLERGFGNGDPQAIVAGIADGDKVMLQFPGLLEESGYLGRDQATYALDSLFNKVKPTGFERTNARGVSAEQQYHITATWAIDNGGKSENRVLYVTLQKKNDRYSIASIRSASK